MKRYSVCIESVDTNLSHSQQCLYTFQADNDIVALKSFNEEHRKARSFWPKTSRLHSGGVYWKNTKLIENGRHVNGTSIS
jgi:hypothetical protein